MGQAVEFTGVRVTDESNADGSSWSEYSEAEYECANTNGWLQFGNEKKGHARNRRLDTKFWFGNINIRRFVL